MTETVNEKPDNKAALDELAEPPLLTGDRTHALWPLIVAALKTVYDPEIPVNMYELGLIYKIDIRPREDGKHDLFVDMSLTSPGCPVAQEIPLWVQGALLPIEGVGDVDVELVWDPPWDPSMMAETAKMELNMFM
ncbi:MAG: DUF59 domain-containing protein [Alphaproteobacteria bacterium]|nr:DUF59 domain-containing protein [Alphaproteobacteria bacterium]